VRALALVAILLLAGCAAQPQRAGLDWSERRAELLSLEAWQVSGRVAVAANGRGASASLDWQQAGSTSDVWLRGPFGSGALRVLMDDGNLVLEDGRGGRLAGEEAHRYLLDELGTDLPFAALRFWLLGMPAPGEPSVETLGGDGRIASFRQSGWVIEIPRYQQVGDDVMPARLAASDGAVRVKLAVGDWELGP